MARSANVPPDTSRGGTPELVAGRFRLEAPIGRGGAGVVWRGLDEVLQRPVAVKEILVPLAGAQHERETHRARFLREARALARLNNPSIVAIYDVEEEAERYWIIMELVDAESLGDVIRNHGPLPPDQVAAIGAALIDALNAAHQKGVLHRDVKPGNVLLGRDGRVRLTDFGIAATEGDMTLTGTGSLVGSPAYIAPERIRGSSGSPSSDLWGLAATLYSAVEGTPPYEGPETYAVLTAVVEGRRRPFHLAGPLRSLLEDILDNEAEDRPTPDEVRQRLLAIARDRAPVPDFVINGTMDDPDAALDALDGGPASRSGASPLAEAPRDRSLDDDAATPGSDEFAGLESVSSDYPASFPPPHREGPRRAAGAGRGNPLVFAAIAAAVVIVAAFIVVLLLRHPSTADLRSTTSSGDSSSPAATEQVATYSAPPSSAETTSPVVVQTSRPASVHTSTRASTSPTRPATTPPASATPSATRPPASASSTPGTTPTGQSSPTANPSSPAATASCRPGVPSILCP